MFVTSMEFLLRTMLIEVPLCDIFGYILEVSAKLVPYVYPMSMFVCFCKLNDFVCFMR